MSENYVTMLRKGVPLALPSGLEVRVKPIDTGMLLSLELPPTLMAILEESLTGINPNENLEQQLGENVEKQVSEALGNFRRGLHYFEVGRAYGGIIAQHCFVMPRVVQGRDPVDESEILIDEISTEDLMALAQIVNVPLMELADFRFGQGEDVESVAASEADVPVTESGDEPEGVGDSTDRKRTKRVVDDVPA